MLRADVGKPSLDGMPVVCPGEGGNYHRNWTSEDTWQIGFARKSSREREGLVSRRELGVDTRSVPARVDAQKSVVRHQDADQSVENKGRCRVIATQALVAESSRNVRRPQKGNQQVAFRVAKTCALAENLGSAQSNPSLPRIPCVRNGVAHPIEKDGGGVDADGPRGETSGSLADCIGLPVDDIAGCEKWCMVEGSHCEPGGYLTESFNGLFGGARKAHRFGQWIFGHEKK